MDFLTQIAVGLTLISPDSHISLICVRDRIATELHWQGATACTKYGV